MCHGNTNDHHWITYLLLFLYFTTHPSLAALSTRVAPSCSRQGEGEWSIFLIVRTRRQQAGQEEQNNMSLCLGSGENRETGGGNEMQDATILFPPVPKKRNPPVFPNSGISCEDCRLNTETRGYHQLLSSGITEICIDQPCHVPTPH
jgi:hypothetical protein